MTNVGAGLVADDRASRRSPPGPERARRCEVRWEDRGRISGFGPIFFDRVISLPLTVLSVKSGTPLPAPPGRAGSEPISWPEQAADEGLLRGSFTPRPLGGRAAHRRRLEGLLEVGEHDRNPWPSLPSTSARKRASISSRVRPCRYRRGRPAGRSSRAGEGARPRAARSRSRYAGHITVVVAVEAGEIRVAAGELPPAHLAVAVAVEYAFAGRVPAESLRDWATAPAEPAVVQAELGCPGGCRCTCRATRGGRAHASTASTRAGSVVGSSCDAPGSGSSAFASRRAASPGRKLAAWRAGQAEGRGSVRPDRGRSS